jgi:hypothetical protein
MRLLLVCVLLLLVFPSVHALSLNIAPSYDQSETVVVEIEGTVFTPIASSQIQFLRGHVQTVVNYDLQKLGDRYFIYFVTPRNQNNYTLILRDVDTTANGERQLITLERNFSTTNQSVPYNVRPALIHTDTDFQLTFTSFMDQPVNIPLGSPLNSNLTLPSGETLHTFSIGTFAPGLSFFMIGPYALPIYNSEEVDNTPPISNFVDISPRRIEHVFVRGREPSVTFIVRNIGTEELSRVVFVYNESRYTLKPARVDSIDVNKSISVNVTLKDFNAVYDDSIRVEAGDESFDIPVRISYNQTAPSTLNATNASVQGFYCNELGGKICTTGEQCSGSTVTSLSGSCCIGSCSVPEKSSLAWIGYLIGALILVILVIIGGKYLKARTPKGSTGLAGRVAKLEKP